MPAVPRIPRAACRPAAAALALAAVAALAGCGEQELYEAPGSPFARAARLPLPSAVEGVAVIGERAYLAGGQAGLHCVLLDDPAHPQLTATLNTTKYAVSLEAVRVFAGHAARDIAYVVEGTEGVTSYEVTDPAAPVSFNQGSTATDGVSLFIVEGAGFADPVTVYLAESWKGVRVFTVDPADPGLLAYGGVFAGTQGYARGVAVRDGWAYVADDEMGLAVLDARQLILGAVRLVAWHDTPGNAQDVVLDGDHAFVADGTEGLAVFRVNGGDAPVPVAQLDLAGFSRALVVRDGVCALAAAGAGAQFVDVSDPAVPVWLGAEPTTYATDIAFTAAGLCLVTDRADGLIVLAGRGPFRDVTPPARVDDLAAAPLGASRATLTWTATGDDRLVGRATACELRVAATPILDEAAWAAAAAVPDAPAPAAPGEPQTFVVAGLSPVTGYHFALRLRDDAGLLGALSNDAAVTTLSGSSLREAALDRTAGTPATLFAWSVVYENSDGLAPLAAEARVDDGALVLPLQLVAGDYATGALLRAESALARGAHVWAVRVTAPGGVVLETDPVAGPLVGAAVFTRGSPAGEAGRGADEPVHVVVLTDSVAAWPHEVTQGEWTALGLANPSRFAGDQRPVESVTWLQAVQWCNLRSLQDGLTPAYAVGGEAVAWDRDADGWRLPTEAEWEWLCRAGTTTALPGGELAELQCGLDPVLDGLGWYCGNAGPATHEVAGKAPNARGLYDLHGNVQEWCWDWYAGYPAGPVLDPAGPAVGFQRVTRGGDWYYFARACRSAARGARWPDAGDDRLGLRPVRTLFAR